LNMKERSNVNLQIFGDRAGATVFPPEVFTEIHGELADISLPFVEDDNCYMRSLGAFFDRCRKGVLNYPLLNRHISFRASSTLFMNRLKVVRL
jgi:hypothetical protein